MTNSEDASAGEFGDIRDAPAFAAQMPSTTQKLHPLLAATEAFKISCIREGYQEYCL
jgi:hypothetical protein